MAEATKGGTYLDSIKEQKTFLSDFPSFEQLSKLHAEGLPKGDSSGWSNLDEFFTVAEGMLTTITGYPGSGKSSFMDALAINLLQQDWKFLFASFENQPKHFHAANLVQKFVGKPFAKGLNARLTENELIKSYQYLRQRISFIDYQRETDFDTLISAADEWSDKNLGKLAVVIDPYNELEQQSKRKGITETEYISDSLRKIRQFARCKKIHVFIVAHPRHIRKDADLVVPRPDTILGSSHWWAKSDFILTVHRNQAEPKGIVEVHVQKSRWSHLGKIGVTTLKYHIPSTTYYEVEHEPKIEF